MKEKENKISAGKKTWKSYDQWGKYEKKEDFFKGYEQVADEVRKNNEYLLEAFKQ